MKIGVVSDTHRMTRFMDKAVPYLEECDLIIHAGDNYIDARYLYDATGVNVLAVVGNCDWDDAEDELFFEAGGKKFFVCHGDRYDVKYGTNMLQTKAERMGADVAVFGHSHVTHIETVNGILYINPGSMALPRGGSDRGFVILDIKEGKINVKEIKI
ncbi:metallophosphoesterase [Peptacetobacter hominis]|uniref:Phosphoesterase n=1 Tax=Peptacetobacter hominis TaxID=2743610 RepID=A0A544QXS3_9FIRM|nr:metallophosphoesterase [Peptacetobacter hominis]TQQ85451.1 metallophosphoesterase [Peptacetobacter hominis]